MGKPRELKLKDRPRLVAWCNVSNLESLQITTKILDGVGDDLPEP